MALNKAAAGSAYKCFKERRVTKAYLALVRAGQSWGMVTPVLSPSWQALSVREPPLPCRFGGISRRAG